MLKRKAVTYAYDDAGGMGKQEIAIEVIIRDCTKVDIAALQKMYVDGLKATASTPEEAASTSHYVERARKEIGKAVESPLDTRRVWALESAGVLIGMIGIKPRARTPVTNRNSVELYGLRVAPSHQRKGYGTTLVEHVELYCLGQRIPKVALTTQSNLKAAIALYTKMGYTAAKAKEWPGHAYTLIRFTKEISIPQKKLRLQASV